MMSENLLFGRLASGFACGYGRLCHSIIRVRHCPAFFSPDILFTPAYSACVCSCCSACACSARAARSASRFASLAFCRL